MCRQQFLARENFSIRARFAVFGRTPHFVWPNILFPAPQINLDSLGTKLGQLDGIIKAK
jgi:hypothetical protein